MANRTIYVSDDATWNEAARYARTLNRSLSWLILVALREYLTRHAVVNMQHD